MTILELKEFFKWCLIWCGGFYAITAVFIMVMPGFVFNIHAKLFRMERRAFDLMMYGYLGIFKVIFIVFVFVPFLALCSMT